MKQSQKPLWESVIDLAFHFLQPCAFQFVAHELGFDRGYWFWYLSVFCFCVLTGPFKRKAA